MCSTVSVFNLKFCCALTTNKKGEEWIVHTTYETADGCVNGEEEDSRINFARCFLSVRVAKTNAPHELCFHSIVFSLRSTSRRNSTWAANDEAFQFINSIQLIPLEFERFLIFLCCVAFKSQDRVQAVGDSIELFVSSRAQLKADTKLFCFLSACELLNHLFGNQSITSINPHAITPQCRRVVPRLR